MTAINATAAASFASSMSSNFEAPFAAETWAMYGTGIAIVVLRFICRYYYRQAWRMEVDDWLMLNATLWFSLLVVSLNKIVSGGGSNLMTPEEVASLTPERMRQRIQGAKWVMVSEQALIVSIWSMKGSMLILYYTLMEKMHTRTYIKWLGYFTGIGFITSQVFYFSMCLPFQDYWAVPVPTGHEQCATYEYYLIVQGVFNISTDTILLLIALPLFVRVCIPMRDKLGLLIVFGMGIFVIAAAVLNKVYSVVPALLNPHYTFWYMREATVAVYVTNLPLIWIALRRAWRDIYRFFGGNPDVAEIENRPYRNIGPERRDVDPEIRGVTLLTRKSCESEEYIFQGLKTSPDSVQHDVSHVKPAELRRSTVSMDPHAL